MHQYVQGQTWFWWAAAATAAMVSFISPSEVMVGKKTNFRNNPLLNNLDFTEFPKILFLWQFHQMHISDIFAKAQQTIAIICVAHNKTCKEILGETILKSADTRKSFKKNNR